eukprot:g3262.t1
MAAEEQDEQEVFDVVVIGAGVSGVATAKCCLELGLSTLVIESKEHVGGLWRFDANDYGVMSFTHINVSKQNYSFSDFPFPPGVPDFPHHTHMARYIESYVQRFSLRPRIRFGQRVVALERAVGGVAGADGAAPDGARWLLQCDGTGSRARVLAQLGAGTARVGRLSPPRSQKQQAPRHRRGSGLRTVRARSVAIACGHHAEPLVPRWPGQAEFERGGGRVVHSVHFNDAQDARLPLKGQRVLVVGIGNSAIDAASNAASVASSVAVSTRSGAWIFPNHIFGSCTDHFACRAFLALPWRLGTAVTERILQLVWGCPHAIGLRPRRRALASQPSVSGTFIHHVRRGTIAMRGDVARFSCAGAGKDATGPKKANDAKGAGPRVHYADGHDEPVDGGGSAEAAKLRGQILDASTNEPHLYKNVFAPEVGDSLAFIGFVQPASGGIITMSETQARWFALLQLRRAGRALPAAMGGAAAARVVHALPPPAAMRRTIDRELAAVRARYGTSSRRHTIQRDPHTYNDDLAARFGAKPVWWRYALAGRPALAFALAFGSGGAAQWRLRGPGAWRGAAAEVLRTPIVPLWAWTGRALVLVLLRLLWALRAPLRARPYVALALVLGFRLGGRRDQGGAGQGIGE